MYFRLQSAPMTSASRAAQPPLILCIDDTDIALRVKKLLLDSVGYKVLTAQSAEDGFELSSRTPSIL
jgi:CheY-like chemotaxis protein